MSADKKFVLGNDTRFFYGLGAAPYGIKDNGFSYFLLIFYSQVLGLSPVMTSAALSIAIIVDAITDPIIGYISDNWRSRWGRRHPFMYMAIIPICVSYAFMWNPPADVIQSQQSLFVYLVVMAISVRIFLTFFEVPNTALISELTDDYDARTQLMGLRYMFGWLGGIGMAFLAYAVFLRETDDGGGILAAAGYGYYGIAAACLMFFGMLVSSIGTHRHIGGLHVPPVRERVKVRDVVIEVLETMKNRSFQSLFLASIFSGTAAGMQAALSIYFSTFFWGLKAAELAIFTMFQALAACCAVPIAHMLGKRFDKKRAAMGSFVFMISFGPLMLFGRVIGVVPENDSPWLLPMLLAHNFIEVCVIIVFSILFGAMMADVVEDSAVDTTRRSEGVIFAARGFAGKMVSGLGILLAGVILSAANLPRDAAPEDVDNEVLVDLVLYAAPGQILLYSLALLMITRYRISRAKHADNVTQLETL
ncbi:MAG: Inner membrane symporter YicJ [Rhodobiaceae bacterium UBA7378]|nr:MAG: Inner membrane symporter YicJ [Rhodobiaceae bacterium UBA7378]